MQCKSSLKLLLLCFPLTLFAVALQASQEQGWRITTGESDAVQFVMRLDDTRAATPVTARMDVGTGMDVISASLLFPTGFSREATRGEITYYWNERGAQKALWNYVRDRGQVAEITVEPDTRLPRVLYGRTVSFITHTDLQFIGRLLGTEDDEDWFALQIEGAEKPVRFNISTIREVFYLK